MIPALVALMEREEILEILRKEIYLCSYMIIISLSFRNQMVLVLMKQLKS